MNRQTAFDTAVTGIITQGGRSEGTQTVCAYRGRRGRKCAIGFLIKDEDYRPIFENFGLREVVNAANIRLDLGFLCALQTLHDGVRIQGIVKDHAYIQAFREKARDFAQFWELSAKVLDDKPLPEAITACLETELEPA